MVHIMIFGEILNNIKVYTLKIKVVEFQKFLIISPRSQY